MYRLDQNAGVIRVDIRLDAVAQVEHVPWTLSKACEHPGNFRLDAFGSGVEDAGVEIALERNPVPHQAASIGQIRGPVYPQGVNRSLPSDRAIARPPW